jgi:uncharacterized protein (TIGR03118 family)
MNRFRVAVLGALLVGVVAAAPAPAETKGSYTVTPLVSNGGVPAAHLDAKLENAWGLVASATSPWWVADNGTDFSTLYNAAGTKLALEVSVPGAPTGLVANSIAGTFLVGASNARFIFDTEAGQILGWAGGPAATVEVDNSAAGAVYKGLAYAVTATGPQLYATDFANNRVDVIGSAWNSVTTAGGFVDSDLPAGYAPFGIQAIGSRIFVTFAKQGEDADEVDAQSLGIVDAFDVDGHLLTRVAQHGQLNAPWGLAQAPADFGSFSGDLLVGNFGDGEINAYEELPNGHFEHRGVLRGADNTPLSIDGLWALEFGHGALTNNGPLNTLFFTAGPNEEADGLFGTITAD